MELDHFLAGVEGGEQYLEDGGLVLSELVANAVRHAGMAPDAHILIRLALVSGMLRIEVHDGCDRLPAMRAADGRGEGGRGLWLVEQLSAGWGCEPRMGGAGKSVWCLVAPVGQGDDAALSDRTGEGSGVITGGGLMGVSAWDGPVAAEIENVTSPAMFDQLPDAVSALWEAVRRLPMGSTQFEAYRYFFTRADAVERVSEFIRRDGELSLSLKMDGRLHRVRIWPRLPGGVRETAMLRA
ncbi:histidine kinase-like protein [Streptomyces sp. TLI_235]|nr:ATP-binding protein [Streptomyces sp. TLI_235]PBC66317.1 histidine kinase-like protein [Streptomyces sp. TLI_235]